MAGSGLAISVSFLGTIISALLTSFKAPVFVALGLTLIAPYLFLQIPNDRWTQVSTEQLFPHVSWSILKSPFLLLLSLSQAFFESTFLLMQIVTFRVIQDFVDDKYTWYSSGLVFSTFFCSIFAGIQCFYGFSALEKVDPFLVVKAAFLLASLPCFYISTLCFYCLDVEIPMYAATNILMFSFGLYIAAMGTINMSAFKENTMGYMVVSRIPMAFLGFVLLKLNDHELMNETFHTGAELFGIGILFVIACEYYSANITAVLPLTEKTSKK